MVESIYGLIYGTVCVLTLTGPTLGYYHPEPSGHLRYNSRALANLAHLY
jgi:hypothetical protein